MRRKQYHRQIVLNVVMKWSCFITLILVPLTSAMTVYADEIYDILPYLIQVESSGRADAVSKAGAIGLCQITRVVVAEWNVNHNYGDRYTFEMMFNEPDNKRVALWYLRRLKNHYLKDFSSKICNYDRSAHKKTIRMGYECMLYYQNDPDKLGYEYIVLNDFKIIDSPKDYKLALILAAYNMGPMALKRIDYDINKAPKETKNYVRRVMKLYKAAKCE